ncbi:bifunctional 3-demethylubiquinol 3-O-methyltransferase/2-polyprenyl-6-hydroxyphenol methylase [Pacificimonas flava]|uniref:Ubiquinone biosynthesis O-methyltransferase n=2 Tax=Pacificimonas TaxID=1960290 RepID=A0A219B6A1_9SPHN|nr:MULTISPECIES: bifunctional 2-polyprenyl-6-hydroxyphenol methylase/3-demethylubiquinol 3-O-methyltransferase UbiG [Pacificimonas]MBZ6379491.1 bifunctional 2-polyprenyl-6-hydroxyphenol methylase/3-demethylubiquinol 3-O-methyltransferase UbiG [Pacificimonas aurantium]OWV33318.1 bifunctional 3-demethylubiquinol 3-O-methyltransferase/2-polyprenyl-6-hydroxyphenol methylase [Pacificimonas flava]
MSTTVDPAQAELFSGMAAEWWDRKGSSALLHQVNPVRLKYICEVAGAEWQLDTSARRWLEGCEVLDVGCGGGILSECLARLGGEVTAIDAASDSIDVARSHAADQGLEIDYRLATTDVLEREDRRYDLVTCMEVVEHVLDVPAFLKSLRALLKPGGLLIFSTPNRTAMSFGVMILGAEWVLKLLPRGTHDWDRFLTPEELTSALALADLDVFDCRGINYAPGTGFALGPDKRVNYIGAARPL